MTVHKQTSDQQGLQQQVRQYLVESFLSQDHVDELHEDDDLLSVLDSLQILRMVVDFERRLGVRVENSELTAENLGTLGRLAAFWADKLTAR